MFVRSYLLRHIGLKNEFCWKKKTQLFFAAEYHVIYSVNALNKLFLHDISYWMEHKETISLNAISYFHK